MRAPDLRQCQQAELRAGTHSRSRRAQRTSVKSSITFSGDLNFNEHEFPYAETESLEAWRMQWISLNERESETAEEGLTLKALRQKAKEQ